MRRIIFASALLTLITAGAVAALAADRCGPSNSGASAQVKSGASCNASAGAACEAPKGKLTGRFDAGQSSVCRFACATKLKYDPKDVMAQPGVKSGQLTQCPVSGVVFAADKNRPRVRYGAADYVTCCDRCATKLRQTPRRYLKA